MMVHPLTTKITHEIILAMIYTSLKNQMVLIFPLDSNPILESHIKIQELQIFNLVTMQPCNTISLIFLIPEMFLTRESSSLMNQIPLCILTSHNPPEQISEPNMIYDLK